MERVGDFDSTPVEASAAEVPMLIDDDDDVLYCGFGQERTVCVGRGQDLDQRRKD